MRNLGTYVNPNPQTSVSNINAAATNDHAANPLSTGGSDSPSCSGDELDPPCPVSEPTGILSSTLDIAREIAIVLAPVE